MTDAENDLTPPAPPARLTGEALDALDSLEGLREQATLRVGLDVSGLRSKGDIRAAIVEFDQHPPVAGLPAPEEGEPDVRRYRLREDGSGHRGLVVAYSNPDDPRSYAQFEFDDQWRELPAGLTAEAARAQALSVGLVIEHLDPEGD